MNVFNIEKAFTDKKERGWDTIFIAIDVHGVIIEGKYNLMNEGASYMPNCLNVLRNWSNRKDVTLILWTCSKADPTDQLLLDLENTGIHFKYMNENPECPNTDLCDFDRKFYFNILLEDKAGFDGLGGDWFLVEKELRRIGEWKGSYVNHSGGAQGSDMEWENQGLKYGVKTIAYSFEGHSQYSKGRHILSEKELAEGAEHAEKASHTLMRPWKHIEHNYVKNLLSRNWFQVKNADTIFAVGQFVKNSMSLVDGGTGWAVQMAIDSRKSVYLFDQVANSWFFYDYEKGQFQIIDFVPILTENFAGIGTRKIDANGKKAISNVYEETFK